MRRFEAGPNEDGMRLSRFVQRVTLGLPDPAMYKHFRNKRVKVNGRRAAPDHRLAAGDVVELYINDEFFPSSEGGVRWPRALGPLPDFSTVYEDADIAVLYKPTGVLSHRDAGAAPTLLDAFTEALVRRGEYDPDAESQFAPALCNRLDRGTEGLVLAAKNAVALRSANAIIREDLLEKDYLCICEGAPPKGTHHAWLARDRAAKTVTVTENEAPGAKPIATRVKALARKGALALCEVGLLTGRTHQIRAHLAFLGAPLLGDAKYGDPALGRRLGLESQALCAWRMAFAPELPEGLLPQLAGKSFTADMAALPAFWHSLQG